MSAEKIGPQHRARKAVLYVRQSSAHQVQHNRESQALQYAMRDRLVGLGFAEVEIVDEDLGCSAAGGTLRAGFERMVAEVCLGKVGAVAAREVSRFARNSRDWQQLVEVCRVVDTLLVGQEAIYAPRLGNDRLLLGLKGSLNEYELDLLRQRSLSARYEKARRGELVVAVPVGFLKAGDRLEMDPDRRVQAVIRLSAVKPFERSDAGFIRLDRVGCRRIVVERASLVLLHPDAHEVAREVMALGLAVQRLARQVLLYDLTLERDAIGTVSGHGLHPQKTQRPGQSVPPEPSTPRSSLQSGVNVQSCLTEIYARRAIERSSTDG